MFLPRRPLWTGLVLAALAALVPPASAQNTVGACAVLTGTDAQGQTVWSGTMPLSFADCAQRVGYQWTHTGGGQTYGQWAGNWILVNERREIYWSADRQQWTFWAPFQGGDGDGDGIADAADRCAFEPETVNGIFDTDGCPDTLLDLTGLAIQDLDVFWRDAFMQNGLLYRTPTVNYYSEPTWVEGCGDLATGNAFYCRANHGIFYDIGLMNTELVLFGDFAPVVILAHEWGHSIQGLLASRAWAIANELQADCLAGAYAHSLLHAPRLLLLEEGDLEEGARSLFFKGDDLPWFDVHAHGTPQMRWEAYHLGLNGGLAGCFQ